MPHGSQRPLHGEVSRPVGGACSEVHLLCPFLSYRSSLARNLGIDCFFNVKIEPPKPSEPSSSTHQINDLAQGEEQHPVVVTFVVQSRTLPPPRVDVLDFVELQRQQQMTQRQRSGGREQRRDESGPETLSDVIGQVTESQYQKDLSFSHSLCPVLSVSCAKSLAP